MQIHYCEKCGKRIAVDVHDAGTAVQIGNSFFCPGCVPAGAKPATVHAAPGTGRQRKSSGAVRLPPSGIHTTPAERLAPVRPSGRREARPDAVKEPVNSGTSGTVIGLICIVLL